MRTVLLSILLTCVALTSCRKHSVTISPPPPPPPPAAANTLVAGTLIKSPGSWTHSDGRNHRTLRVDPRGTDVTWSYEHSGPGGSGSNSSAIRAAASSPWFIYVEVPERIWIFDGRKSLFCHTEDSTGSSGYLNAIGGGVLLDDSGEVPAGLIQHLPADLQKLFPDGGAKPRPSI